MSLGHKRSPGHSFSAVRARLIVLGRVSWSGRESDRDHMGFSAHARCYTAGSWGCHVSGDGSKWCRGGCHFSMAHVPRASLWRLCRTTPQNSRKVWFLPSNTGIGKHGGNGIGTHWHRGGNQRRRCKSGMIRDQCMPSCGVLRIVKQGPKRRNMEHNSRHDGGIHVLVRWF